MGEYCCICVLKMVHNGIKSLHKSFPDRDKYESI